MSKQRPDPRLSVPFGRPITRHTDDHTLVSISFYCEITMYVIQLFSQQYHFTFLDTVYTALQC